MGREEKGGAIDEEQRQDERPSRDVRHSREARRQKRLGQERKDKPTRGERLWKHELNNKPD